MSNQIETQQQASLGAYLKRKRVERGLTQSEVASKLGYGSPQFISNIERGISSVPLKSLKVIIDLYQLPADEVLDVLVSEKKNYWKEQLGIGGAEASSSQPLGTEGTHFHHGPASEGQRDQEHAPRESNEDTPILFSSNRESSRDRDL